MRKLAAVGVAAFLALFAGCQKKTEEPKPLVTAPKPVTVEVVKESERSRSFLAVSRQLELGGTVYGYVDIDGDVLKLMSSLQGLVTNLATVQPQVAPFAKQDFAAIAASLGLTDVKAVGVSSVPDGTGFFRNRVFLYTPSDRHGLLLGLGGKPAPLAHVNLAPADTAFYSEADLDVPAIYQTLKEVVTKVAGEPASNQLETALQKAGENVAFSVLDLIHGLKGRSACVVRIDPERVMHLGGPTGATVPEFSLLICVDSVAGVVEPALTKSPLLKRTDEGTLHIYESSQPVPVEGLAPVLVVDGTTLYFATTRSFLNECRSGKPGLAQSAEFQRAISAVGAEGNGVTFVSPRFFDGVRRISALNPNLPPQAKSVVSLIMANVPKIDRPLVAVRTNLPDGILLRAYWDRSLKQDIAMAAVYNPVSIGLLSAMAIPAFQKVRTDSQEKAVLNNLRQLSAAADQFYLEKGATTATYNDLVGPGKYVRRIQSVAGENYRQVKFVQGQPLRVALPGGKVIEFAP